MTKFKRLIIKCLFEGDRFDAEKALAELEEHLHLRALELNGCAVRLLGSSNPKKKFADATESKWVFMLDFQIDLDECVTLKPLSRSAIRTKIDEAFFDLTRDTSIPKVTRTLFGNLSLEKLFITPWFTGKSNAGRPIK
jgi:hypothetical protein